MARRLTSPPLSLRAPWSSRNALLGTCFPLGVTRLNSPTAADGGAPINPCVDEQSRSTRRSENFRRDDHASLCNCPAAKILFMDSTRWLADPRAAPPFVRTDQAVRPGSSGKELRAVASRTVVGLCNDLALDADVMKHRVRTTMYGRGPEGPAHSRQGRALPNADLSASPRASRLPGPDVDDRLA